MLWHERACERASECLVRCFRATAGGRRVTGPLSWALAPFCVNHLVLQGYGKLKAINKVTTTRCVGKGVALAAAGRDLLAVVWCGVDSLWICNVHLDVPCVTHGMTVG